VAAQVRLLESLLRNPNSQLIARWRLCRALTPASARLSCSNYMRKISTLSTDLKAGLHFEVFRQILCSSRHWLDSCTFADKYDLRHNSRRRPAAIFENRFFANKNGISVSASAVLRCIHSFIHSFL